jgi:hypothetical protein
MSIKEDIIWFKQQFGSDIQAAIEDTPFRTELFVAIALQETGYLWRNIYKKLDPETGESIDVAKVLELCVGDTLDAPNRSAFPKTKDDLVSEANGDEMFAVARAALGAIGEYNETFGNIFDSKPNKFCHGFGIFQYDIQFFKENPEFFLAKKWFSFDECLKLCLRELQQKLVRTYGKNKNSLTDTEMVYIAIAYNKGSVDLSGGFKQGFKDDSGKFYGEYIWEYLQLVKNTNLTSRKYKVNARSGLNVRSGPGLEFNVIDRLPFGIEVFIGTRQNDWVAVDLQGDGAIDGFVFGSFLNQI